MKKYLLLLLLPLTLLLFSCGGANLDPAFDKTELEESAQAAITLGESGDYQSFRALFSEEVQENMDETFPLETFQNDYLTLVESKGAFKKFSTTLLVGKEDEETGESFAYVIQTVRYDDGKLKYTLCYNTDMELTEYYVK